MQRQNGLQHVNPIWQRFYKVAFLHPKNDSKKMAKLNIDFILLDESVVMHGFRALMSGAQLDGFIKNPVMLIQHNRTDQYAEADGLMLPIGKWYDIRIEEDKLLAKPDFDEDDELAQRVQKKVEKGYLNGASIWIEPTVISDDVLDMLPGQSLPTFTKWSLFEASIVDIPNCKNSLAIRNESGDKIVLNGKNKSEDLQKYLQNFLPKKSKMDLKLTAVKLGLKDTATEDEVSEAITGMLTKVTTNDAVVVKLAGEKEEALTKLAALEAGIKTSKIQSLVDAAVTAKKITATERENYIKLATADFETTETILKGMKGFEGIESKLTAVTEGNEPRVAELMKQTAKELYLNGGLEELKKLSAPMFEIKYREFIAV
jgi:hypothetical protein